MGPVHTHTCTHSHAHTYIHMYTHIRIHTCVHTHNYLHMQKIKLIKDAEFRCGASHWRFYFQNVYLSHSNISLPIIVWCLIWYGYLLTGCGGLLDRVPVFLGCLHLSMNAYIPHIGRVSGWWLLYCHNLCSYVCLCAGI